MIFNIENAVAPKRPKNELMISKEESLHFAPMKPVKNKIIPPIRCPSKIAQKP